MCMTDDLPAERGCFICNKLFMCMTDDLPAEREHFICKGLFMCMADDLQMIYFITEALEGFLEIQGYWPKNQRDTGYFCKY